MLKEELLLLLTVCSFAFCSKQANQDAVSVTSGQLGIICQLLTLDEEELRKTSAFREKKMTKPKLALNCVGGQSGTEILKCLSNGGLTIFGSEIFSSELSVKKEAKSH